MSSLWPSPSELDQLDEGVPSPREYLRWLSDVRALYDRAMGDEGIAADVRDRVVARVLHGSPTPGATRDWAEPVPRPEDLAIIDMLAEGFDHLREGTVAVAMGDDSNSGPGWPVRTGPPMNAGGL